MTERDLSRRDFLHASGLLGAAMFLPSKDIDIEAQVFNRKSPEISRQLEALSASNPHFVFYPLDRPDLILSKGADSKIPSASLIKVPLVLCSLSLDTKLSLDYGSDAYRAIVSSNNSAAARLLKNIGSFDTFNKYLHQRLSITSDLGLTQWGYYPTTDWKTSQVTSILPWSSVCLEGFSNPYTLNAALSLYKHLEDKNTYIPQKDRLKQILGISDPEYQTPLDLAITGYKSKHPDIKLSYYGKNGTLTPNDWSLNRNFLTEAVILSVNSRRFALAYSAETANLQPLLTSALDLAASL